MKRRSFVKAIVAAGFIPSSALAEFRVIMDRPDWVKVDGGGQEPTFQGKAPGFSASESAEISGGAESVLDFDGQTCRIHAFTSIGSAVASVITPGKVDILVVGGGGGASQGGGGAGGLVFVPGMEVAAGDQTIIVGDGGDGCPGSNSGCESQQGGQSSAFGLLAKGGGGGGYHDQDGKDGASGGGGGHYYAGTTNGGSRTQPGTNSGYSPVHDSGNGGGEGATGSSDDSFGGGGGGAGQPGSSFSSRKGGDGGDGIDLSAYFGTDYGEQGWFAGGGGGGIAVNGGSTEFHQGFGGKGGGGNGTKADKNSGVVTLNTPPLPNSGGGAGGAFVEMGDIKGGSGIVLIRYAI